MKDHDLRLFCELHHQISTFSPMKASSLEELRPDLGGLRSSRLGHGSNAVSILAALDPQAHGGWWWPHPWWIVRFPVNFHQKIASNIAENHRHLATQVVLLRQQFCSSKLIEYLRFCITSLRARYHMVACGAAGSRSWRGQTAQRPRQIKRAEIFWTTKLGLFGQWGLPKNKRCSQSDHWV